MSVIKSLVTFLGDLALPFVKIVSHIQLIVREYLGDGLARVPSPTRGPGGPGGLQAASSVVVAVVVH